jgi:hypothetical protein
MSHHWASRRIGFNLVVAISLFVAYFSLSTPSPRQACDAKCHALGKQGHLVYSGSATSKQFFKEAQSECRCQ